jgi:hypothetical protein
MEGAMFSLRRGRTGSWRGGLDAGEEGKWAWEVALFFR